MAVSLMPQRVMVFFPPNECFRTLSVTTTNAFCDFDCKSRCVLFADDLKSSITLEMLRTKILQFHLDAVQNWGLDKEQNIEKITFLLFHAKKRHFACKLDCMHIARYQCVKDIDSF